MYVFFNPNSSFGQEKIILGKVQSLNNDVANVLVVNLNSKKSTITDSLGLFYIEAKLRDSIRFTAVQYLTKEIIITDKIVRNNSLTVNLIEDVINLTEVIVTPYNLTGKIDFDINGLNLPPLVSASTLSLPNADVEKLTQSERLLLEADRGKFVRLATFEDHGKLAQILGYASLSVVINTHKIMNRVSGRTNALKESLRRDENNALEKKIIAKFSKKTMSESFDIPESSIDSFLSYCLLQEDFSELAKGNTMEVWGYLKNKSVAFKEQSFITE